MKVWLATTGWAHPAGSMYTYAHQVQRAVRTAGVVASPMPIAPRYDTVHAGEVRLMAHDFLGGFFGRFAKTEGSLIHDVGCNAARRGVDIATLHDLSAYHDFRAFRPPGWSWSGADLARAMLRGTGMDSVQVSLRRARGIVAVSDSIRDDVAHFIGRPLVDKVRVIHIPFDPVSSERLDPQFDAVWVGKSGIRKQMPLLLQVIGQLPRARFAVRWAPGPAHPELTEPVRLALHDAKNVTSFERRLTDSELDTLYRQSRCYISTSIYEGLQMPPIEAYLRGTRVVVPAGQCSSTGQLLRGEEGVHFYRPGQVDDLRRAVLEAIDGGPFRVSTRIRDLLSLERIGREFRALYEELE